MHPITPDDNRDAQRPAEARSAAAPSPGRQPAIGKPRRRGSRFWVRIRRRPGAIIAAGYLLIVLVAAVAAPWVAPYSPYQQDLLDGLKGPSGQHWLGTDQFGRDNLSRLIYGARISMGTSFTVIAISLAIALPLGLAAGYFGRRVDYVFMRFTDAGLSLPPLVMALAIAGILGPGVRTTIIALVLTSTPFLVRFIRGEALARSQETYIEASRVSGTRVPRILAFRVLPNIRSGLFVTCAFLAGGVLLAEAALSYLGVGAQPPLASWGSMLQSAYATSLFTDPFQLIVPGAAIALTILAFNTLGDGLRDALGTASLVRQRGRRRRGLTSVSRAKQMPPGTLGADGNGDILLAIRGLTVEFDSAEGPKKVVEDVSLSVRKGEVVGLVGESGSGKTVTALSVLRLMPSPPGRIVAGTIEFEGRDLLGMNREQLARIRGARIGMIFQDPMTALDPCFKIGKQLEEAYLIHHRRNGRGEARRRALELLERVHIPSARERLDAYPHELSGGMRQRVMIAMALACEPVLLIADEPTTALDVTIQAQVLALLREIQRESGMAILFVTHDLGVVAELCDRVVVMYAGQVVETNTVKGIFCNPRHPYSHALVAAMPQIGPRKDRLVVIPGHVPLAGSMPLGCRFNPRCSFVRGDCSHTEPELEVTGNGGSEVRCLRSKELSLKGEGQWATTSQ